MCRYEEGVKLVALLNVLDYSKYYFPDEASLFVPKVSSCKLLIGGSTGGGSFGFRE